MGAVEEPPIEAGARDTCRRGRRARAGHRASAAAVAGVVAAVLVTSCGTAEPPGDVTAGSDPAAVVCEPPPVTGTGDAARYPGTLDELVADADLVVDARIVGESGAVDEGGQRQPMAIAVAEVFRGDAPGDVVLLRAQTSYTVNGTPGSFVGAWNQEPWYCPGERYVLFLERLPDGGYLALSRQGALRTDPPPEGAAPTDLVASLRALDPDALRAEVRAASARVGP